MRSLRHWILYIGSSKPSQATWAESLSQSLPSTAPRRKDLGQKEVNFPESSVQKPNSRDLNPGFAASIWVQDTHSFSNLLCHLSYMQFPGLPGDLDPAEVGWGLGTCTINKGTRGFFSLGSLRPSGQKTVQPSDSHGPRSWILPEPLYQYWVPSGATKINGVDFHKPKWKYLRCSISWTCWMAEQFLWCARSMS